METEAPKLLQCLGARISEGNALVGNRSTQTPAMPPAMPVDNKEFLAWSLKALAIETVRDAEAAGARCTGAKLQALCPAHCSMMLLCFIQTSAGQPEDTTSSVVWCMLSYCRQQRLDTSWLKLRYVCCYPEIAGAALGLHWQIFYSVRGNSYLQGQTWGHGCSQ